MNASPHSETTIGATVLGYPRIGRTRELKKALEKYWAGNIDVAALNEAARAVRLDALDTMAGAGLDTVPVNTFSWYDHMLDTAVLVDAIPARFRDVSGTDVLAGFDAARYFAMARGTGTVPPLEMTKWFDTNYHYLVPEIGPDTRFTLRATKPVAEYAEAVARGVSPRPVVVGPFTFLSLAKAEAGAPDDFSPLSRLNDLVEVYAELLAVLADPGVAWVQIDEPALVRDLNDAQVGAVARAYERLAAVKHRPKILVATYFGSPVETLPVLAGTAIEGLALDLLRGPDFDEVAGTPGLAEKSLVLGAVDGRNVWRNDLTASRLELDRWRGAVRDVSVSTSCSLLHVPYDVEIETDLDPALKEVLAFADQKLAEVVALHGALHGRFPDAFSASDDVVSRRDLVPGLLRPDVTARAAAMTADDRQREPRHVRQTAQRERLTLPLLPTTTIGSFPQTRAVRVARADFAAGRSDLTAYTERMQAEIRDVVALQERIGLDVLVHGEPERNDMVQYFAEQLDGYASTRAGWVQSYGSRCVRPPILYGDVHRPEPMTVEWATYAQGLTAKPVKGMLTGPVTMLAWAFVRDDQPRAVTADQVALALRDEVIDLEAAGISMIQVDEPALRELLPLRAVDHQAYLDWSVGAFRLATSSVAAHTQVHTHLCYSEFGEIIEAIDGLNADVTSVEAARSDMELLASISERGFDGDIGPGVYDIHSPRVPDQAEIEVLIGLALTSVPAERLWINPDCGLKTRGYAEVEPALIHMVEATRAVRARIAGA
ncbi:5-methyltetrahydropteroyltriglutamate--homocysteine S-methyltransferase [Tessaracoccus antarcticus]|uniref:5-methyltetrahydropteroyltriglutamate--homocysteine methyltransferase n=1 Tax=Tessaracoccus antarcticus TaxID=2479848 RepID=A0A3M0G8D6_9ACTN|nr:5-methyltetrahydropteroyltriglutamate--homocysteine S-methyltransferase [Tessaracoccus antarcticus]RMB61301.1 5-methyltetrahydropteroyltriglutamate--homocysteine S-methyltransferase [Tessaracoccus antarcticus]